MNTRPIARANLIAAVKMVAEAFKTEAYYSRALRQAIRDLYNGGDPGNFIDKMIYLVDEQFKRAWNEGARAVGFDPANMTDDDKLQYMLRAEQEKEFIIGLAEAVQSAKENKTPITGLYTRADMWSSRYREVVDYAKVYFGGKKRLKWIADPAKDHCTPGDGPINCLTLNGTVATAEDWQKAREQGIYPKSSELACHGYHCGCRLEPTTDPVTPGGIPGL